MPSLTDVTQRAYQSDWLRFQNWCLGRGRTPLPSDGATVADYLDASERYAPATLGRWVSAINRRHREAGFLKPGPESSVRQALAALRATRRSEPRPRHALRPDELVGLVEAARRHGEHHGWGQQILARRDVALMLVGFTGALGSGALSALRLEALTINASAVHLRVESSGRPRTVHLPAGEFRPTCTPCAVLNWGALLAAGDRSSAIAALAAPPPEHHLCAAPTPIAADGPLFPVVSRDGIIGDRAMGNDAITDRIRTRARHAGWNEDRIATLGGQSLRRGRVASGLRLGESLHELTALTGHASLRSFDGYRDDDLPRPKIRLGL